MDERRFADPEHPHPERLDGPTVEVARGSFDAIRRSKLLRLFVLQVVLWNVVLLAVSLGGLLIYFRADWRTGSRLIGVGVVVALYGAYRWPRRGGDE